MHKIKSYFFFYCSLESDELFVQKYGQVGTEKVFQFPVESTKLAKSYLMLTASKPVLGKLKF